MVAKAEITSQDTPAIQYPYLGLYRYNEKDNPFVVLFTALSTGVVVLADIAEEMEDFEEYLLGAFSEEWADESFEALPAEKGVCIFNAA